MMRRSRQISLINIDDETRAPTGREKFLGAMLFLAIWIGCGIFNYGAAFADDQYFLHSFDPIFEDSSIRPMPTRRDSVGISAFMAFTGPPGSIFLLFDTDFCQHGWDL
jgi:hypothetical protein